MSNIDPQPFYVAGGTVPVGAASYVTRRADQELYTYLLHGEFCYVLTSRQMGKSSLMARTAVQLRNAGVLAAVLDLTSIGKEMSREQWYYSLLIGVADPLSMRRQLRAFWSEAADLLPLPRFIESLRSVLRQRPDERLVIFIDEIDNVLALPFSTGEFFAAIRACYNRRSEDPEFQRLTFCLIGVASPADLISDPRLTPFNIGRRIELHDFTAREAAALEPGFGGEEIVSRAVLERVLYWTGGHPYLTQRLCQAVVECGDVVAPALVDRQCEALFLSSKAREQDDNLVFVRERLLKTEADEKALASLLDLYKQVCSGRRVRDDKASALVSVLQLSGVLRSAEGILAVRNRIYAQVFDQAWITAHMPGAEVRRQRAAFRKGVLRALFLSSGILTPTALFAVIAFVQWRGQKAATTAARAATIAARQETARANREREKAVRLLYAADINSVQQVYHNYEYGRMEQLLEAHEPQTGDTADLRGFEWRYFWRLMHRDRHTFFHKGNGIVSSVAFSPDGRTLASSNGDGAIELWDLASWHEVTTLSGHKNDVFSVTFSPDGRWLASASLDKTVKLWDVAAQRLEATLEDHKSEVYSVAFSPDGRRLASGDRDGEVKLWDVASHHEVASRRAHQSILYSVAFSPDGRWLATGSEDGTIKLWAAPSLSAVASFLKGSPIYALALSPDSKEVAVGRADGNAEVWDVATRRRTAVLTGHKAEVNGIAFSPDGRYLATGSWDDTIRLWYVATGKPVGQPFIGHTNRVTSVAFSPDGSRIASGGSNEVKVWDPWHREQNPRRQATFHSDKRTFFSPGHSLIFSPGNTLQQFMFDPKLNAVMLWDVTTQTAVTRFPAPDPASAAALSQDGKRVAIGTAEGSVRVRNAASGRQIRLLRVDERNPVQGVAAVAFSPDGRTLAAASGDPACVTVWDVASGREEARFQHTNAAKGVAFSPDGKTLAAANWQGRVYLWDLATKTLIDRWWAHAKPVNDVAFSPDGKTLATAGDDATVKLWNVATHREMVTLTGPRGSISSIAFSPDGNQLAAASDIDVLGHQEIRIWEASSLTDADATSTRP